MSCKRIARVALTVLVLLTARARAGSYEFRGVIFGAYGRPWSHVDRLDMLRWMGEHGMNLYIHAAKDDVYQRLQWRDPYPEDRFAELSDEIAAGLQAGVRWVPNLSPGFPLIPSIAPPSGAPSRDVCFSCAADRERVLEKLQRFYDAGARVFMVSFDDVQKISSNPEDLLVFGAGDAAYGKMNASLLNYVEENLPPDSRILTVPADYSGTAQTDYLASFGAALDPAIQVMWTGTAVVSHQILSDEAKAYSQAVSPPDPAPKRKLLIWDNFPVNDYNGNIFSTTGLPTNFKLNVGPYKGRRSDLVPYVAGIVANPMNEAQASKLPLFTVARYLLSPDLYTSDPPSLACPFDSDVQQNDAAGCRAEGDWRDGIAELGGSAADALGLFVAQMRSTPMDRSESVELVRLWKRFAADFSTPFWRESWNDLVDELSSEAGAAPRLRATGLPSEGFLIETRNHLIELERNAHAGLLAAGALAAERPSLGITSIEALGSNLLVRGSVAPADPLLVGRVVSELTPLELERRTSPYSVHGDRLQQDLGGIYLRENRMDAFADYAAQTTAAWLPLAPLAAKGPLVVTVNGTPAPVSADGSFSAAIPGAAQVEAVVTDAAGSATGERRAAP